MSCNGCRVLRKGCGDGCILRPCLQWIEGPEAQAHATLFVAKFFGRADLMSFISAVPHHQRPALFQSLLLEACGRTVNPVNGAVGLLSSGNWHLCQAAVDTVLRGGVLRPFPPDLLACALAAPPRAAAAFIPAVDPAILMRFWANQQTQTTSLGSSETSGMTTEENDRDGLGQNTKLLNLFV